MLLACKCVCAIGAFDLLVIMNLCISISYY